MEAIRTEVNAVLIRVKVVPGASRTRVVGLLGDRIKLAVAAPPEKGLANKAVMTLIAQLIGVRKQDVRVVEGATNPLKTIRIEQATADRVREALQLTRS